MLCHDCPRKKDPVKDMNVEIHEVCPQFSREIIDKVKQATTSDEELMMLKMIIHEGWPTSIKGAPQVLKPYWSYRDEITIGNEILMKGEGINIPSVSSLSRNSWKSPCRTSRYREKISCQNIRILAENERRYRQNNHILSYLPRVSTNTNPKPLIPTKIPPRLWYTIVTELFYLDNTEHLLVSDYHSKCPFVRKIPKG